MHLPADHYHRAYEHIRHGASQARPGQCTVVLLVAYPDVDALCCCRILTVDRVVVVVALRMCLLILSHREL